MSIITKIAGLFRPPVIEASAGRGGWVSGRSVAGVSVNNDTAMRLATVFACIRNLSEDIAKLPVHVYQRRGDTRLRADGHAVAKLLRQPNPLMTKVDFVQCCIAHAAGWGNKVSLIARDRLGEPMQLWPLAPDKVRIVLDDSGIVTYEVRDARGNIAKYNSADVLHIRGLSGDGVTGYNVIQVARESMGCAMATDQMAASFFGNGMNAGSVLQHPSVLSQEAQDRLRESWEQTYAGSSKAHKMMILEEGMTFEKMSIAPEEAQFLETRQFSVVEICRWFRMPPHKVADLSRATFSNIEHQNIDYVVDTLMPWFVRLEAAIDQSLFSDTDRENGYFVKFNFDALLRGDTLSRYNAYQVARSTGWMSVNEIRAREDLNPIEGGDGYIEPMNMKPLGSESPDTAVPPKVDISPVVLNIAERISAAEAKHIATRADKATVDIERFTAWVTEWACGKHAEYVAKTIAPMCAIVGRTDVAGATRQITDTAISTWTANHNRITEATAEREAELLSILKDLI